jgi:hypothetical protein
VVSVGEGSVQRRNERGQWEPLPQGEHTLPQGADLRLASGSSVTLARGEDRTVLHGPSDVVVSPGAERVELRTGRAELRANTRDV